MALRFVTVGLRPNIPQRSALGPWGCVASAGQWHCVSSRLACGQMFLKAAPPALGVGALRVRATGVAFRHGWPSAKCSSKQRPGPWGGCVAGAGHGHCVSSRLACGQMLLKAAPLALGGCVAGAGHGHCVSSRLAFGQMFLTAAPRPAARGSASRFSTKNTPNVENPRKE